MTNLWKGNQALLSAGLTFFTAPLWGALPANPGAINYVEGQVAVDGQQLNSKLVGSVELQTGQVLQTEDGKAEVLLTPGVLLRLGPGAAVRMDSPGLTDTRVAVLHGEAMVEVTQIFRENHLQIADGAAVATLEKKGVYAFEPGRIAVYDGQAQVREGDSQLTVKKGKAVDLQGPMQVAKFNRNLHDDLYNWSNLRSEYLAQAAEQSARTYVANAGGWYGGGWCWNPGFGAYSYLPGDGMLYSPFGWGFYSPSYVYYAPMYRYSAPIRTTWRPLRTMRAPGSSSGSVVRGFSGGRRR